jgi:CelD/BcsL family acetyltransferase involved in cellulose biosynthesis
MEQGAFDAPGRAAYGDAGAASVAIVHDIEAVRPLWERLAPLNRLSPGQDFAFIKQWIEAQGIAPQDCYFVVAAWGGAPVALLPLHRRWSRGIRVLSWFPRAHVGCNAPLIDAERLAGMNPAERKLLWRSMRRALKGADTLVLGAVPLFADAADPFAEIGDSTIAETLYRSVFSSWADADQTQRNKSRRKHDRQQGERLGALGAVEFTELGNGPEAVAVLDTMFRQRAARFVEMGVRDPFACPKTRSFYDRIAAADSGVAVKLHVLRLNGEIVAVRYSIAMGDRLFCLISSMSDDPAIQGGSPGKQCLLRVMQTVFDAGCSVFDMGAGFTDEKRHWCNQQVPLRTFYLPLTLRGAAASLLHRHWQALRCRIKGNERLLSLVKAWRRSGHASH